MNVSIDLNGVNWYALEQARMTANPVYEAKRKASLLAAINTPEGRAQLLADYAPLPAHICLFLHNLFAYFRGKEIVHKFSLSQMNMQCLKS